MLSQFEAAVLTRPAVSGGGPRIQRIAPRNNRIGAALVVLSLLSAVGLLHTTVSGRSEHGRVKQGATDGRVAPAAAASDARTSVIDPSANGDATALWLGHLEFERTRP